MRLTGYLSIGRDRLRSIAWGAALIAGAAAAPAVAEVVTCESKSNNRAYCRANTSGGVHVRTQLSMSSCHQGSSWGYDKRGIWVANGCRAVFATGSDAYSSDHHAAHENDQAAAAAAGLALLAIGALAAQDSHDDRQRDRYGDTYTSYQPHDDDWRRHRDRRQQRVSLTCSSNDSRYKYCDAPVHRAHVRMVRRLSSSACEFNRDWGYDRRGVWVDNGCRAKFEID